MNGLRTKAYLNIIPLGSYDFLIGMDWLDKNHVVLDCYNKAFTFLDEEGNLKLVQGIPRAVTVKEISTRQLKRIIRKGCKIYAFHMEEITKDKVSSPEYFAVLGEFEYFFWRNTRFYHLKETYISPLT
jgi:hypothetical protein